MEERRQLAWPFVIPALKNGITDMYFALLVGIVLFFKWIAARETPQPALQSAVIRLLPCLSGMRSNRKVMRRQDLPQGASLYRTHLLRCPGDAPCSVRAPRQESVKQIENLIADETPELELLF